VHSALLKLSAHIYVRNPAVQVEISLQPWLAFKPDGVILFSDILTPLTGMNIPFDITAGKGPIIAEPIRTMEVGYCYWVIVCINL
jgi:uroporphyrinogen-III decarboxylase